MLNNLGNSKLMLRLPAWGSMLESRAERETKIQKCTHVYVVDDWIEEPESRDPLVTTEDSNVFRVFAVRHTDAVRLALRQGVLFPCALNIIKPDAA